jgi:hypothetical protein
VIIPIVSDDSESVAASRIWKSELHHLAAQDHDPVARMIETMNTEAVDIMVADEDWRGAVGETNTGVVLVRNCNWSITFFTEILQMQANNVCKTNEQACFRSLVAQDHNHAKTHVHVDSGLKWNRHPSDRRDRGNVKMDWDTNPATEIVHFMGGAKPGLEKIDVPDNGVCSGEDTGRTAQTRCIDVDHCALVSTVRRAGVPQGKRAFVLVEPLDNPPGQRFLDVAAMRAALEMAKAASADAVYIVPQTGVARYPLTAAERTVLRSRGFTLHEVPWVSPTDAPTPLREACGGRGFLSIHALALESYVTVIVLGPGVVAQQKAQSLFDCSGGDSKASRLLHAGNLVTRLAAIQPSSAVFTAVFKAVTLLSLTAARRNGTDCGLALVVALLCDPQHASAIGGGKCQPLDVCKWARTAHDDAPCSAVGIPCTSSRVMMADACR